MTFPFPGEPTPENLKRFAKAVERFKSYEDKVIDEYVVHFGEDNEKEIKFIQKSLQQQRTELIEEFMECLPEFKVRDPYNDDFNDTRWNDCLDQFLKNLRDKGIIK